MTFRCDIYRVARECRVILRNNPDHSPTSRRPRECYCKHTLREVCKKHGEAHLRLVLMLMTGTPENSSELYSDMIKAVSALMVRKPELLKRASLVEDFNAINLSLLREQARDMDVGIGPRPRLDHRKVARRDLQDFRPERLGKKRPRMRFRPLGDEDRRALSEILGDGRERRLRAAFGRARVDNLVRIIK